MKVSEMPEYCKKNKPLGYGFIYCCICVFFLILQIILIGKGSYNYYFSLIFLFLIPGLAAGSFAFHCVSFTEERPTMLILMPLTYFLSLLINELLAFEVNAFVVTNIDTYPYIPILESIPLIAYCICVSTNKFKKQVRIILIIWVILVAVASVVITAISLFLNVRITHQVNYIKATMALVCGLIGVLFMYLAMLETLKLSGSKVTGIPFLTTRRAQLEEFARIEREMKEEAQGENSIQSEENQLP